MGNFKITLKSSTTATSKTGSSSQLSIILVLITLAQFMTVVDFTIVQVALPSIGSEFGVSVNGLQWIVTTYGLTLAGFLLLSGRVGDMYGRKRLFIIGVLVFSLASMAGGIAPSENVLILARVVQGLGAAMASATGLSILVSVFPEGKARNRALSVFAAASGSGFAAGMILGGVITATLGWRWVFDINVPIGLVVSLLSVKYISSTARRTYEHKHLDIFGAVSVTAGLMLLVYCLSNAQNIGIGSLQTLELLLSSVIVLAAFLLIEYRSKAPLMPLGFLRRSSIFGANAIGLLQFAAFVAMVFILTNYLQQVRGYSALSVGLVFLPGGIVSLVTSAFFSAQLVNRFGVKPIIISGMALQTIAYLLLSPISITESYIDGLLGPMLLIGVGTGLGITAINISALTGTRRGEEGLASGLINTSRQIGGPIGLAVLLTVANFETPHLTGQVVQSAMAMVTGFGYAFLGAALLTGIGIIFTALLKQQRHSQAGVVGTVVTVHQS
ncbi:MAG TPA: MFS transporter [Ktedonobacteraceae bacterium]|nr:MFS transporter [Ktedonobacteraceae bacterium]